MKRIVLSALAASLFSILGASGASAHPSLAEAAVVLEQSAQPAFDAFARRVAEEREARVTLAGGLSSDAMLCTLGLIDCRRPARSGFDCPGVEDPSMPGCYSFGGRPSEAVCASWAQGCGFRRHVRNPMGCWACGRRL
ncbi:MAG: hypothetical protein HY078_11535 [Elusimicrobia bacterium]|nr:hypothetical protein [Elusimicrobiota bacterium]